MKDRHDSLDRDLTNAAEFSEEQGRPAASRGEQSTFGKEDSSVGDLDDVGGALDDLGQVTDLTARYEIQEELGRGGMGVIQNAFDRRLKPTVAIKRLEGDILPPEQRRGATEVDARSDLWSVGATLYQMLAGRPSPMNDTI